MKKYFIVSDVHGYYTKLKNKLDECGFDINNENHIFVNLGDLMDRGSEPRKCLKFVNSLPDERKILIRGNHEDLLEELVERGEAWSHDVHNGTYHTALELSNYGFDDLTEYESIVSVKDNYDYQKYMSSLVDYYEDDKYIFVHGWIPCKVIKKPFCDYDIADYEFIDNWRTGDWKKARWINGIDAAFNNIIIPDKTIYCGHWHSSYGWARLDGEKYEEYPPSYDKEQCEECFAPFRKEGLVAMDACTAYTGMINCEVLEVDD